VASGSSDNVQLFPAAVKGAVAAMGARLAGWIDQCPLSGVAWKTSARTEFFSV
jgi:hypothetical protein